MQWTNSPQPTVGTRTSLLARGIAVAGSVIRRDDLVVNASNRAGSTGRRGVPFRALGGWGLARLPRTNREPGRCADDEPFHAFKTDCARDRGRARSAHQNTGVHDAFELRGVAHSRFNQNHV